MSHPNNCWPGCQSDNRMMEYRSQCYQSCQNQSPLSSNLSLDVWNNPCIDTCQETLREMAIKSGWDVEKRFIRRGVLWSQNEFQQ